MASQLTAMTQTYMRMSLILTTNQSSLSLKVLIEKFNDNSIISIYVVTEYGVLLFKVQLLRLLKKRR